MARRLGIGGLVPQHNSEPGNTKHSHKINVAEIAMVIVIERERCKSENGGGLWKLKCGFNYSIKGPYGCQVIKTADVSWIASKILTKTDVWELSLSFYCSLFKNRLHKILFFLLLGYLYLKVQSKLGSYLLTDLLRVHLVSQASHIHFSSQQMFPTLLGLRKSRTCCHTHLRI